MPNLNVRFTEHEYQRIAEFMRQTGKTKTQIIRDAFKLEVWFYNVIENGGRVLVQEDGKVKEVVLR